MHPLQYKILICGISCFLFSAANCQITVGPKVGVNFCYQHIVTSSDSSYNSRIIPGLHIGANFQYNLSRKIFLQSGLLFTQKGSSSTITNSIIKKQKIRLSYLEVPIMFNYQFSTTGLSPFIGVGAAFNFGISGSFINEPNVQIENDVFKVFKRTDPSLKAQLGISVRKFQLSLEYIYGVNNIVRPGYYGSFENRVADLSIIYSIYKSR